MISIKFLFKDSKSGHKGEVPSLFNQKKSKYLQQFDSQGLPKSYQAVNGFYQISKASTFVQWAKSREKHPRQAVSNCKSKKGGGDWSTIAQFEASRVQAEAPLFETGEPLSVVPEGRESAETTMNQDEAASPPTADAGVAAVMAAEATRLDAIEKRQDEAGKILMYMETANLPVFDSITTARMAEVHAAGG